MVLLNLCRTGWRFSVEERVVCFIEPHTDRQTCVSGMALAMLFLSFQLLFCYSIPGKMIFALFLFVLFISLAFTIRKAWAVEDGKSTTKRSTCLGERLNNAMEREECANFFFFLPFFYFKSADFVNVFVRRVRRSRLCRATKQRALLELLTLTTRKLHAGR